MHVRLYSEHGLLFVGVIFFVKVDAFIPCVAGLQLQWQWVGQRKGERAKNRTR